MNEKNVSTEDANRNTFRINPHVGHRRRLRERFLTEGLSSFEAHNVLELLLFFVIPKRDTNELAHRLIDTFGSLRAVFDAPVSELIKVNGIKNNAAVLIKLVPAILPLYFTSDKRACTRYDDDSLGKYLTYKYIGEQSELVYIATVDKDGNISDCIPVFRGNFNSANLSFRKIAEIALGHEVRSVVIAHNHPGGSAYPTEDDIFTTRRIISALAVLEINVLEHYIIANNTYMGMLVGKKLVTVSPDGKDAEASEDNADE